RPSRASPEVPDPAGSELAARPQSEGPLTRSRRPPRKCPVSVTRGLSSVGVATESPEPTEPIEVGVVAASEPPRSSQWDRIGPYVPGAPVGVYNNSKLTQLGVAEALSRLVVIPSEHDRVSKLDRSGLINWALAATLRATITLSHMNDEASGMATGERFRWEAQVGLLDRQILELRRDKAALQKENADLKVQQQNFSTELQLAAEKDRKIAELEGELQRQSDELNLQKLAVTAAEDKLAALKGDTDRSLALMEVQLEAAAISEAKKMEEMTADMSHRLADLEASFLV